MEMKIRIEIKMLALIGLCSLLLAGCARFIVPETGAIAEQASRIAYEDKEKQTGVLATKDLLLEYTLIKNEGDTRFTGKLAFDRSLTDSFPNMKTFFLKMNWLDADGAVLKTVDITPGYRYLNYPPNTMKIDRKIDTVHGSKYICFSYYGVFQGERPDVSEEWAIHLFPFTAP